MSWQANFVTFPTRSFVHSVPKGKALSGAHSRRSIILSDKLTFSLFGLRCGLQPLLLLCAGGSNLSLKTSMKPASDEEHFFELIERREEMADDVQTHTSLRSLNVNTKTQVLLETSVCRSVTSSTRKKRATSCPRTATTPHFFFCFGPMPSNYVLRDTNQEFE